MLFKKIQFINTHKIPWFFACLLVLFILIIDQLSKQLITAYFQDNHAEIILTPFFNLILAYNKGAAFSFLANENGWQRWFFIVLTCIIVVGIIIWIWFQNKLHYLVHLGLLLILGGAIGNLIDRVLFGYVIDFIDFHYQNYHWPTFNIADTCISIGAFCLILDSFFTPPSSC